MRPAQERKESHLLGGFIRIIGLGAVAGGGCTVLLLLLMTEVFVLLRQIPQDALFALTVILAGIGAFCGGWIAGRISGSAGFLYGICCGGLMFVLLLVCGICFFGKEIGTLSFLRLGVMLLAGMTGGIVGVNRRR